MLRDEPTGTLDYETGKRGLGSLRGLNRQLGMTVVIVIHNPAIRQIADRVVRRRSGEIVEIAW